MVKPNDTSKAASASAPAADAQELVFANKALMQELAETKRAMEELQDEAQRLRSLAIISADWYWEQDAEYRFTKFATEVGTNKLDKPVLGDSVGNFRWGLSGIVPLSMSWDEHRAVLDAHEPFRDFEYLRDIEGQGRRYFSVSGVPIFGDRGKFLGYRGTTREVTESRQAEDAQARSSRFLDDIVDNIPVAVHLKSMGEDGRRILVWNKAAEALYGLTREEALGRTVHDLWPKAMADQMYAADQELMKTGEMQAFPDRTVPTKNRGLIHVHMRKVPLRDANGVLTHVLVTAEEITDRLAAEARLRHSEARFRSLTHLSSDWYWEMDEQFRFTKMAGGTTDQLRSMVSHVVGKTRWEIDPNPAHREMWARHRAQLERHETFRDFDYEYVDPETGTVRIFGISGEPMIDGAGGFTGYRGVGTDVTARKQTETALRTSEARFRTVVSALAEGVVLRDADGRIVECNASAERILGKTLAQMKGLILATPEWEMLREDGTLMPDDERPNIVAMRTGKAQTNAVVRYRKQDGTDLWSLINVQPLFDVADKPPTGYVTTITDITKRKRAESEIVRLNVDLENRVLRRTAQLEAANKELEAFSYSVAHDLRSPLSAIDGYGALLQKAVPADSGERAHHYLARMRSGVRRMGELTDGLLSLAQLSRTSLTWDKVDLSAEAARVLKQWSENDSARNVRVTVEPGLVVRADVSLLRQVLENLIANAWKFTSKKPEAEISVGKLTGPDQQTVYFVKDNGAGFDMAYSDKLFGTFQRLHSPEEFAGSGIGLATVNRIVTRHGGKIWAQSVVGEGTTFYFTLGNDPGERAGGAEALDEEPRIALAHVPRSAQSAIGDGAGSFISTDNDALSVSDQQFSSAFEHAAIGMALIGVDSRRLRVNSAFCQMLGYSEAEMLSRTVQEITHPDDVEWDVLQRKRALAGEIETYQWEKRYIHQSGRIVWGYLTCSLVRDSDRKPLHFISQVQDITERKETERAVRESEERFRALTELSSDWFWEQDENFRFIQISGDMTHAHLVSATRTDAIGKTRWELDHVNMEESVWEAHKAQLERHEIFRDFEVTRLDSAGNIRYVTISGVPIFDASGKFTGYRGTGRDNTEMHRVSDALRASESQLRQITDTVPALIAYVDVDQRFRFHNRAYEEAFGLLPEQIDGKTLLEVMGPTFYEVVRSRVEEVLTGYPVVYERTQKTPRGDHRDYVVNYFPRYGDGEDEGDVIGFFSLATDITELKRIDRMKSEFVSTVSHELRTPLTSIRGSLGLISGGVAGQLPDAVKTLVGIAKNNCERLIRLINDILDIEKIESGKMRLELQVIELKPLMVQALAATEGFGAAQNVGLTLNFPDDELQVNVDGDRLTQVITNLLSNAMKFSPPGEAVEVHVTRGGIGVRVEVRDRGPGIPEEFRNRIFQKFSQADSSDTRQKGGTGLGLNISRAIIERLGGSIGFTTGAGVGTVFFFELPEWKVQPESAPTVGGPKSDRPRILICEDDRDIARLLAMMLDKGGFDADMAYSGAQALSHLAQGGYAAMTVDLQLPDQSGIALISTLRRQEHTRDLPIVVVSAIAGESQIQLNNQPLSVSDWLEKPIDENLLILGLRRAIDGMAVGKPRILHVEDDLDIQRITAAIAQDFATFEFAATLGEARARLFDQKFDLILLDLTLPGGSGWDLLSDIEALDRPPPVVVFSAVEVDRAQSGRAAAVLLKAQTSNVELLETLQRVLSQSRYTISRSG
ncbi:MAG TPA: PAS domain S-box protein [Polaromonas sp.]|uniref:PAS domain S-box protein n=1 Tax=Polaromonas sp. TaxID=1869339 RepID=UPI002D61E88A|nr:PAS domain S-box protein [Polaromonas sp.]HYW55959.1 PAS domain S-box protein [Polaromonas sp.]